MARRLFPDNNSWSQEASHASNDVTVAFADVLALLEEDGPIDLKDFHFIVTNAVGSFVAALSINRRLGDPATPPDPIIRAYPGLLSSKYDEEPLRGERGTQGGDSGKWTEESLIEAIWGDGRVKDKLPATMDEDWNIKWNCALSPQGNNTHCVYNDETDPMHDECVYCGQPQERK